MDPALPLLLASIVLLGSAPPSDAQYYIGPNVTSTYKASERGLAAECGGTFNATLKGVIDGSTLNVEGCSRRIKLALVETPIRAGNKTWYKKARVALKGACPTGSTLRIDSDRGKKYDSYGRMNALVYCLGTASLNSLVIYGGWGKVDTQYCDKSEFGNYSWAREECRKKLGLR